MQIFRLKWIFFLFLPVVINVYGKSLIEIYDIALINDLEIKRAEFSKSAVLELPIQYSARSSPSITLGANSTIGQNDVQRPNSQLTYNYTTTDYFVSITQPIYRRELRTNRNYSEIQVNIAIAVFNKAHQDLLFRVAKSYFNIVVAQNKLDLIKKEKKAVKNQLGQLKKLLKKRKTFITDVNESKARHNVLSAQQVSAKKQLSDSNDALREITGKYFKRLKSLQKNAPLTTPKPQGVTRWVDKAVHRNFELALAQLAVTLAKINVETQRSQRSPKLDLTLYYSLFDGLKDIEFSGAKTNHASIALQLNWNIYDSGLTSSLIRQAQFQLQNAQIKLKQKDRAIVRKTRGAYFSILASVDRIEELKKVVRSQKISFSTTLSDVKRSNRTNIDVINARAELFNAMRELTQARYDYIINTLLLKKVVGTLNRKDLVEINDWLTNF